MITINGLELPMERPADRASILVTLTDEELAQKVTPPSDEEIENALKRGQEERRAAESCEPPPVPNSRVLFR